MNQTIKRGKTGLLFDTHTFLIFSVFPLGVIRFDAGTLINYFLRIFRRPQDTAAFTVQLRDLDTAVAPPQSMSYMLNKTPYK